MTLKHKQKKLIEEQLKSGFLLHQNGKKEEAKLIYQACLKLEPQNFNALQLLGLIYLEEENFESSIDLLKKAIKLNPTISNSQINIANAYSRINKYEEAIHHYSKAILINSKLSQPYYGIGLCHDKVGQIDFAIANYKLAIELDPNFIDAYLNLGACLEEKKIWNDAINYYDKAIKINPLFSMAYNNRANALRELFCFDEAIQSYQKALSINPSYLDAYCNLGITYRDLTFYVKALDCFNLALSVDSNFSSARFNKSLALLSLGDLKNGFLEYEWRWESKNQKGSKRVFQNPLWLGDESLLNKTILIYGEQGLGDMIQFCRYIEMLAGLGANIVLEVPSSLHQLMKSLKGVSQVVTTGEILPYFDYQCPMMSLPLAFKTELATIPAKIPYLSAPEEKKQYWQRHLGSHSKLRVGLVWSGGVRLDRPELWTVNNRRNIPLQKLTQLQHPKIQFYSLQKGDAAESELRELRENNWAGPDILDFTGDLIDFADTAALIDNLDLIISVDTSIVHLAGALGKPVWVLNRYDSCWRWLIDRNDSPWYPTLKLYRQESYGNWDEVIIKICNDLSNYCKNFTSNS